ncbi:hypothetical protein ACIREM_07510 [Streptomyces shenzhenensis]
MIPDALPTDREPRARHPGAARAGLGHREVARALFLGEATVTPRRLLP